MNAPRTGKTRAANRAEHETHLRPGHTHRTGFVIRFGCVVLTLCAAARAQTDVVIEFPDPALFYQNTTFALDGDVGYVPSFDDDVLWSFSTVDGSLLDPDGLALPGPATASDPYVFADGRLAIPGWFPSQGLLVVDIADPTNLQQIGFIPIGSSGNIQGQNVEVDDDGVIGYAASFPNDTLYSFNVAALALEDPDGLALPGNPDRIARAGSRVAVADTTHGDIIVVDVTDPSDMTLAGVIDLPGAPTFRSNDNIAFAADGRTGFISSDQRVVYSFDVVDLTVLDPDGLTIGTSSFADHIAIHNDTLACVWSNGLAFVDASDPTDLRLISNANFGTRVAPQGNATVAFSADGTQAAIPVIYPDDYVYTFDVATGQQVNPRFPVDDQPNYLTVFGPDNRIGVLCSGNDADNIHLIAGLLDTGVPCEAVKRLKAKCKAGTGKLKIKVVLKSGDHDGATLTIDVNGEPFDLTIRGKKAKLRLKNRAGPQTVTLTNPPNCKDPVTTDCG